jgi:AraC family transcriptional regulator
MKNNDLYTLIKMLINYIEDNIEDKLTLELLSNEIGLSKFHFIRVFKNLTNITIMDYVRSRKLASSLKGLLTTDMRIIDIANQYNFEHEQTYIRAFRNEYGITPSKFRKNHTAVEIIDKINMDVCTKFESGILFNAQFVVRPSFSVIGIKNTLFNDGNVTAAANVGMDFFFNHRHKIKNAINPNTYIGLTRFVDISANYDYYMPSIQVSNLDNIPEGMTGDTVPSRKYATFRYIGNHPVEEISYFTLSALFNYIDTTWKVNTNYDSYKEGGFYLEKINTEISSENYCECDLYYPLSL